MVGLTRMIRNTTSAPDPAEIEIPQLADDPRYAAATAYRDIFANIARNCDAWTTHLTREAFLEAKPVNPKSPDDTYQRALLEAGKALPPLPGDEATPESSGPVDVPGYAKSPYVTGILKRLDGVAIPKRRSRAERLAWIAEIRHDAWHAHADQQELCDQIADELTFEYSKRLKPQWDSLQLEFYRDAQRLSRTAGRVREFRNAITRAGIRNRSDVLAMPNVRSPLVLGDESVYDSEISGWRRILESLGIL
jgi:hypothetical protein